MFGVKKEEKIQPDLQIAAGGQKPAFDFFAALAKTLLIFMIVYGALGGFLSAYDIGYNKTLCMTVILTEAFVLSTVYEIGKRWCSYLCTIGLFFLCVYVTFRNYWTINSGYYSIINQVNEVSRRYLGIVNGTEYALRVEEEYTAVTCFALFLGMFGVILLNIQLQGKVSLLEMLLWTFTPYIIPLYFEKMPELIYVLFLLTGYLTVAMLQCAGVREHLTGQIRHLLPLAAVIVILVVRLFSFVWSQDRYEQEVKQNPVKFQSEDGMRNFVQFGVMALFRNNQAGSGVSGGMLSRSSAPMPDYETDLIVRFTPYTYYPMYLKAFTGKDYDGFQWSKAEDGGLDDGRMEATVEARKKSFNQASSTHGRGVMEVENVGASTRYEYRPYYTGIADSASGKNYSYIYYPAVGETESVHSEIDSAYLEVPPICYKAVKHICDQEGFSGTDGEIATQIVRFFSDNYTYSLRLGFLFNDTDYISHFLTSSKKGYCAHFASACTMLFRYMGIPARYVEGYTFSYADVVADGVLVEDARYEDYYMGYSPIGDTALVELEVSDAKAHAWVEIYVDGKGWLVVDPTPASSEEETTAFWTAFMNGGSSRRNLDIGENNLGDYLETVLGGAANIFAAGAVLLALFLGGSALVRYRAESRLTGGERVRLEYGRLDRYLAAKNKDYARLRTVREQMDWVEARYEMVLPEHKEMLYRIFFAGSLEAVSGSRDVCNEICAFLVKVRRRARIPRIFRKKKDH